MTTWLFTLRAAAIVAALTAGACVVPYGWGPSYGPGRSGPSVAYAAGPSSSESAEVSEAPVVLEPPARPLPPGPSSSARPPAAPAGLPLLLPPVVPSASSASRSASPSRAGSRPGEGRERPGRHGEDREGPREAAGEDGARHSRPLRSYDGSDADTVREDDGQDALPAPSGTVRGTGAAVPRADTRADRAAGPPLRILPLGGGLVLIGLGLGLAFFGLRLRRV